MATSERDLISQSNHKEESDGDPNGSPIPQQLPLKTWTELRADIRSVRRQVWSVGARLPHSFTFRRMGTDGCGQRRIYFLCADAGARQNSICAVDVPSPSAQHPAQPFKVVTANFSKGGFQSKAELLMLERKRLTPTDIGSYSLQGESGRILLSSGCCLFQAQDFSPLEYPLTPTEIASERTSSDRINAQMCPHNPNLVAFVCDGDIWLVNVVSGKETRLTYAKSEAVSAGLPSYVMQEEFNRFQGFWWRPKTSRSSSAAEIETYCILYEEVDESCVNTVSLLTLGGGEAESFRFPRPGTPNAISTLRVVQFQVRESSGVVAGVEIHDLPYPIKDYFPWAEYLVRAGWTPDGKYIWMELLDRCQRLLELVLWAYLPFHGVSLERGRESYIPAPHSFRHRFTHVSPSLLPSAPFYLVYSEENHTWVNVHDMLLFLPQPDSETVEFLWGSEESGHRHLYSIQASLQPAVDRQWYTQRKPLVRMRAAVVVKEALTQGPWVVLNSPPHLDLARQLLYFLALKDSPLERHLYVVSLNQPRVIRRLSPLGFSYSVDMDESCEFAVLTFSSVKVAPQVVVYRVAHQDSNNVHSLSLAPLIQLVQPNSLEEWAGQLPDIHCCRIGSGHSLYAMVYKPFCFRPDRKYPVILNVYGGPEVQLVYNCFRGGSQLWLYLLASQGYCVVCIDSRGSANRGLAFEAHIKRNMGMVEMDDQVEVLRWLADKESYLDLNRVGIYGWSYGGYLALMGLIQYPSIFKAAVAGAPVSCWEMYDTGYTERYMDLPENNPGGYRNGSLITHAEKFPDTPGRLLIVHGLSDENVHFLHTAELLNALIRKGKPYQLQVYPCERHSLRRLDASEHYETALLAFLQQQLAS